jgi:hypothetical protein
MHTSVSGLLGDLLIWLRTPENNLGRHPKIGEKLGEIEPAHPRQVHIRHDHRGGRLAHLPQGVVRAVNHLHRDIALELRRERP